MVCVIAGNFREAETWAKGQNFNDDEWFYPEDDEDLLGRRNFHIIVIGTAGQNVPPGYFEKFYQLAQRRGRLK
jgi:hypothetical protein